MNNHDYHPGDVEYGNYADGLISPRILAIVSFACAVDLVTIAVLGPGILGILRFRTSLSGIWQTEAFDITNVILLAPLLVMSAIFLLLKKKSAKYLLVLTPLMLFYSGLEYGLGQEWGNSAYPGNSEAFCWLFLLLMVFGLILLLGSLSSFSQRDSPAFKTTGLKIYVAIMVTLLLVFAFLWISQLYQVVTTGNSTAGDYSSTPNGWWITKFLDLGFNIPLGFIALMLMLSNPRRAYPLLLLFFGYFVGIATAVNASAIIELLNHDPAITASSSAGELMIFPLLAILAYFGLYYLVREKFTNGTQLKRKLEVP